MNSYLVDYTDASKFESYEKVIKAKDFYDAVAIVEASGGFILINKVTKLSTKGVA